MFTKANQTGRYGKKARQQKKTVSTALKCTEDQLQVQCNNLLVGFRLKFLRIRDSFWNWATDGMPMKIKKHFVDTFAGMPDNVIIEPISEKYNLCLQIELKTLTGELGEKQRKWADDTAVVVCRTPDETIKEIEDFQEAVKRLRGVEL